MQPNAAISKGGPSVVIQEYEVGLTGPDGLYKAKLDLRTGDTVLLNKDPDNEFSQSGKAIKVTNKDGQQVGFIIEQRNFELSTCSDIYHLFERIETITGTVEKIVTKLRNITILSITIEVDKQKEKIIMN